MNALGNYIGLLQVVLCMSIIGAVIQVTLGSVYILFQWVREKIR